MIPAPLKLLSAGVLCLLAAACQTSGDREPFQLPPQITPSSPTGISLESLPPPARPVDVALYAFPDLTGQNRPNDSFAEYSRAVTQGGAAFVIDALNRAGGGHWFNVVERGGLQALLQERQLIRATRQEYQGAKAAPLPPLRFAGLILEGGILAYDANHETGGFGARYLGIGGDTKYRRDVVTVALRVVSVQSGQVLLSVTTTKTIFSTLIEGNLYKFVALDRILEGEIGYSRNEPTQLAVREAIELAVYALIMEGVEKHLWAFKSPHTGEPLVKRYRETGPIRVRADIAPEDLPAVAAQPAVAAALPAAPASQPEAPAVEAPAPAAEAPARTGPVRRARTASGRALPLPPPSPVAAAQSPAPSVVAQATAADPLLVALAVGAGTIPDPAAANAAAVEP